MVDKTVSGLSTMEKSIVMLIYTSFSIFVCKFRCLVLHFRNVVFTLALYVRSKRSGAVSNPENLKMYSGNCKQLCLQAVMTLSIIIRPIQHCLHPCNYLCKIPVHVIALTCICNGL